MHSKKLDILSMFVLVPRLRICALRSFIRSSFDLPPFQRFAWQYDMTIYSILGIQPDARKSGNVRYLIHWD